ncbi:glycoside hydrolase family 43 protein [Draconibacterium sp.]
MIELEDYYTPYNIVHKAEGEITYRNPIIPGFYPDPSICRVGEDYYLVTSTFEYFPGVPVFHSKDLVNWTQIGYCIDRKEQLPMGVNIFAPNIQYHDGIFYMITTNFGGKGGNFYVTAEKPEGPWSDPKWVDLRGIDPDLFFDDNGKSYIITSLFTVYEIDLQTGNLLGEGRKIWYGNGGAALEGPHIYKKDGYYYLMAAEGGTAEGHQVTIARALNIMGPYINNPANPVLANENAAGQLNGLHGVGHADIIQTSDDSWWMVFHGYRIVGNRGIHHTLGRETCLAPVSWPKNGWPVVNGNGTATLEMNTPTLPLNKSNEKPAINNFDSENLGLEWNYIQIPDRNNYSLEERKGYLRLKGDQSAIGEKGSPTFVGRRVQDINFTATTTLEFDPKNAKEEAGITLVNNGSHFDLSITRFDRGRIVQVKLQFGKTVYKSEKVILKSGPVKLRIEGNSNEFTFSYAQGNEDFKRIDSATSTYLSSETVGGFTGLYVGMFSTGNGERSSTNADFDWFNYQPNSDLNSDKKNNN